MKRLTKLGLLAATLATVWGSALADINVGVVVSATGPAASLGIPVAGQHAGDAGRDQKFR